MNRHVMKTTTKKQNHHNGFAVEITDATDLGLAMLIAESEDGQYEPVAVVANVGEAREVAQDDFRSRLERLDQGESPLCPYVYKVWARGIDGEHRIACEIADAIRPAKPTRRNR
ncbi:MAG: hypothetical protein SFV54_09210 [Bryobacteraceae bacterium]|nr:hypothetical protein [Bryobacteraceae bacterium]